MEWKESFSSLFEFDLYKLTKSCENVLFPASSNAYGAKIKIVRLSLCKGTHTISLAGKKFFFFVLRPRAGRF
jgi:hypothetical protein